MKDHKPDFTSNPKCRLINIAKPELGKVSKRHLENINKSIRETTKVHQWHNSDDVIAWFMNIQNKSKCIFVQFYPSITENLLMQSLSFAKEFTNISDGNEKTIMLYTRQQLD